MTALSTSSLTEAIHQDIDRIKDIYTTFSIFEERKNEVDELAKIMGLSRRGCVREIVCEYFQC